MKCNHCGEPLPPDALFCGECGRAVQTGPTTPRTPRVSMVTPIVPPPPSGPPLPLPPPVVPPVVPPSPPSPTVIIEPLDLAPPAEFVEPVETSGTGAAAASIVLPVSPPPITRPPELEPEPEAQSEPEPDVLPGTGTHDGAVEGVQEGVDDVDVDDDDDDDVDDDPTTVSPRRVPPAVSATIVASTGQRFQVGGRVLLGRRPAPADGEEYDAVLVIVDDGKTVSKTHLELTVDRQRISVTDLGSGNGTVIETPGEPPVRCVAGVPHPVPRGSRLVLGRQFLMIA